MSKLIIRQLSKHRWEIVSPNGHIVMSDVMLQSPNEAKEFIKNYISSFINWSYEVQPMKVSNDTNRRR